MTETENKDFLITPSPPMSPAKQALIYGGVGIGVGAVIDVAWQAIANWASKSKQSLSGSRIAAYALGIGVIGAIMGYRAAKGEAKAYDPTVYNMHNLTVENMGLQNKTEDLGVSQSIPSSKSFVKQVTESRPKEEHQQQSR